MDDARIISLFNERDESALKEVGQKYGRLCFSVADNILHNREEADECVNDTYLSAWDHIPPDKPNKLPAYLARITRNNALNRVKHENRLMRGGEEFKILLSELNEDISSGNNTEETFETHYIAKIINDYLHSVEKDRRGIFVLRYYFYYPIDDICAKTGRSYNSVSSLLARMRSELKEKLKKEGVEL